MKRSKSRTKTLDPAAVAVADLHAKLDALVRANSLWLPIVVNSIEYAYRDMQGVSEPLPTQWVN